MVFIAETELIIRLVLSLLLGSLIGIERQIQRKPAGLKTHAIVCLGAALFTIVSLSISSLDVARIAAGVVTGIGFLGAGSIFRAENRIEGLTTAADLWVVAAIGLAIGIGYYFAAIVSTLLILGVLIIGTYFEKKARLEK